MEIKEFANQCGLPEDFEEAGPTVVHGYFSFTHHFASHDEPYIRVITLSKNLALGFSKMNDETKARFFIGLLKNTKESQEQGKIFTLDPSGRTLLVTYVSLPHEHVLHVEQR